jgi:two-component system, NarL family, nitrate/nitrite response regulator NarL
VTLRVRLIAADPIRRCGLTTLLAAAGHAIVADSPDAVLCDAGTPLPAEAEAPVLALTDKPPRDPPAGVLPRDASPEQIDAGLRAVAAGLLVRIPGTEPGGFAMAPEDSPLTPRETEILALIGHGLSNKSIARQLGISVHTVKYHIEALFTKLDVTSRAEAVAKGLTGGVIAV